MQKGIRINEAHLLLLATRARFENTLKGNLYKKSADTGKWRQRWFVLYKNLLFYFDSDANPKLSGVAFLEGCHCEKIIPGVASKGRDVEKQYCFALLYQKEGPYLFELRAESESECCTWMSAIVQASYSKLLEQKEQLQQKHNHLLQILDTERQAKWHYVQQTEELTLEVKNLKTEIQEYRRERRASNHNLDDAESEEIRKIKKVQSFFRGWMCRRRWKQIVDLYIRSDHAESMRKRNSIVFGMVEQEEEYVKHLSALVTLFLRPFRMAASSKKPPIMHEDVNSIFLNSETLLFLHQIFLKGLVARMENWPTLVLGDLFDMLLPMLGIYQEYVRNHHYSLQVLAEYKQKADFNQLLRRCEEKAMCDGRSLETFLTYPMHQVPHYIIMIHNILAHTAHDHVERRSLEFAKSKLEELSQVTMGGCTNLVVKGFFVVLKKQFPETERVGFLLIGFASVTAKDAARDKVMQDEVSETENIRKNLAIERMIVQGCDILLDVEQTFVRQGSLIQVTLDKSKLVRLGSFSSAFKDSRKETVRQVFLFTQHMLLTSRTSNGRLHLAKFFGKIPLSDCTLVEDAELGGCTDDDIVSCESSSILMTLNTGSMSLLPSFDNKDSRTLSPNEKETRSEWSRLEFRIIVDAKTGPSATIILMASSLQEKAAWCSDISQCIENLHYSDILNSSISDTSSVTMPQSVRSDPRLYRDNIDIKFSRTLNSCKVPQIRHASLEKLLDRLTDLRFLSIDFLNTFLLTYRVFTTSHAVLEALRRVYRNPEYGNIDHQHRQSLGADEMLPSSVPPSVRNSLDYSSQPSLNTKSLQKLEAGIQSQAVGGGAVVVEISDDEASDSMQVPSSSYVCRQGMKPCNYFESVREGMMGRATSGATTLSIPKARLAPIASFETLSGSFDLNAESDDDFHETVWLGSAAESLLASVAEAGIDLSDYGSMLSSSCPESEYFSDGVDIQFSSEKSPGEDDIKKMLQLSLPSHPTSGSSEETMLQVRELHQTTSSDTLVPYASCSSNLTSLQGSSGRLSYSSHGGLNTVGCHTWKKTSLPNELTDNQLDALALSPGSSANRHQCASPGSSPSLLVMPIGQQMSSGTAISKRFSVASSREGYDGMSTLRSKSGGKRFSTESELSFRTSGYTPRSSCATAVDSPLPSAKAGAVVTSSRASKRRSSSAAAAAAFAAATAASSNPKDVYMIANGNRYQTTNSPSENKAAELNKKRESAISSAATMRVLNILRHWVSKHSQDFERNLQLRTEVEEFLGEIASSPYLTPAELKALTSVHQVLSRDEECPSSKVDLKELLMAPEVPSQNSFDTLSALDIAEEMTYLDHQIFVAIRSEELLRQAWMKPDKATRSPHVLLVTKRFNEASRMVVSEIIRRQNLTDRVACIEKWAAIADICRCLHNYNGVLQICAAFVNSSVFRLKKTWEKISKQTKQMVDRLQMLVSSDGRFKNMRDALHRCDPPCIPYLGMYLTDLSFIDEGTPHTTDDGLINFSKMRMMSHVVREIQHFQQTSYRIDHRPRVAAYLLDTSRLLEEEATYRLSLQMEPRTMRLSIPGHVNA